ncbi:hypothetical protein CCYA_CCYA08G2324 [Cyanidiococcus yangmingshanensis]|nr:hypothetical protein CCYA_CCYA08G2324 [Cyanidiococcus yangmingshanensis]
MLGFAYFAPWGFHRVERFSLVSRLKRDGRSGRVLRAKELAPVLSLSSQPSDAPQPQSEIPSPLPLRPRKTQEQLHAELKAIKERRERVRKQAMAALDDLRSQLDLLLKEVRTKMHPDEARPETGLETGDGLDTQGAEETDGETFSKLNQFSPGWHQVSRAGLEDGVDNYASSVTYTAAATPSLDEMGQQFQGDEYAAPATEPPQQNNEPARMIVECDINGCCSLIIRDESNANVRGVRPKHVFSGPGFRVGYDPAAPPSDCALVGDDHWTIALSREEFRHFRRLAQALQYKMGDITAGRVSKPAASGVPVRSGDGFCKERLSWNTADGESSKIVAEFESSLMWLGASGNPFSYDLRLILLGGNRIVEGVWPAQVVPSLFAKLMELEEPEAPM